MNPVSRGNISTEPHCLPYSQSTCFKHAIQSAISITNFEHLLRTQKETAIETASKNSRRASTSEDLAAEYAGYLTYRISQLSARLNAQATRVLRTEFDLSVVKWRILALLHGAAPVNSAVLCKGLSMDAGLFSRTLKSLTEEGLVKASTSKTDKRQTLISLTRSGVNKYQQAAPLMKKRREGLTDGLSAKDRTELFRMLDILDRNAAKPLK